MVEGTGEGGGEVSGESTVPTGMVQESEASSFAVPEAYQGEKWAQSLQDYDGLFKEHANLQKLLGNRPPPVPGQDASAEEWQSFAEKTRPESADAYDLKVSEELQSKIPEEMKGYFQEAIKPYANIFHELGLSKWQAENLYQKYMENELSTMESQAQHNVSLNDADSAARDQDFMKIMGEKYGAKANDAVKVASIYTASQSPEMQAAFDKLPNDAAASVVSLLYEQHTKFNQEGRAVKDSASAGSFEQSNDAIASELGKLNIEKLTADPHNPRYREIESRQKSLRDALMRQTRA